MIISNITNFRQNVFKVLESITSCNEQFTITTKDGNAVILSEQDYNDLMDSVYNLSNPDVKDIIITGLNTPLEDCITIYEENKISHNYRLFFTLKAAECFETIKSDGLEEIVENILDMLINTPYSRTISLSKLQGSLQGAISRRININHKLIYQVYENEKAIKIIYI